jgi:hypothetical protein
MTLFSLGEEVPEPEFLCGLIGKIAGNIAVREGSSGRLPETLP